MGRRRQLIENRRRAEPPPGAGCANQALNRQGGPRAVNATLAGGGNPVHDLQNALALLRMPAVSLQENAQKPPLSQ